VKILADWKRKNKRGSVACHFTGGEKYAVEAKAVHADYRLVAGR